ncbi:uncharacterized protein LOC115044438 [Echeneis naucrates]|uniref:uncharacterized protein LOC115044438 n=1 Tax=Echeneis naucrates TaxID=173247 RepID=UPI0011132CCF|nr:uncharacterized protein LOC115044438 [Echeneis naucrates]
MAHTTIPMAIADELGGLNQDEYERFCFALLDRRGEIRVRRRDVEKKSTLELTDLLVSVFTEAGARDVTLELLRKINCNQSAKTLEVKTSLCMDKGDPTFRKTSNGELDWKPSQEARSIAAVKKPSATVADMKKPVEVEAEAKALVLSEGGDSSNNRLVLSRYLIQFGMYRGKTFKWLLENDPRYAVNIIAGDQRGSRQGMNQDSMMANKDALSQYMMAYTEVGKEVRFHRDNEEAKQQSLQRGQAGKALVGFGKYQAKTLKALYESKDPSEMSYVSFLRNQRMTCNPGSKMEDAIKYILQRDKRRQAARRRTRK